MAGAAARSRLRHARTPLSTPLPLSFSSLTHARDDEQPDTTLPEGGRPKPKVAQGLEQAGEERRRGGGACCAACLAAAAGRSRLTQGGGSEGAAPGWGRGGERGAGRQGRGRGRGPMRRRRRRAGRCSETAARLGQGARCEGRHAPQRWGRRERCHPAAGSAEQAQAGAEGGHCEEAKNERGERAPPQPRHFFLFAAGRHRAAAVTAHSSTAATAPASTPLPRKHTTAPPLNS